MTSSPGRRAKTVGYSPAALAMSRAREEFTKAMKDTPPTGTEGAVLDEISLALEFMDQMKLALLLRLGQMEASGQLLEAGGQRSIKLWLIRAEGMRTAEAHGLGLLARRLHNAEMPATHTALEDGLVSVGEAIAVCGATDRAVESRNTDEFADADEFRAMIEAGLIAAKADDPSLSVAALNWVGKQLEAKYHPELPDKRHKAAFEARGARLLQTFDDSFLLEVWGPAIDYVKIKAALKPHTTPLEEGVVVSKSERTYDALLSLIEAAHGHQGCEKTPGPTAIINLTVPFDVYSGERKASGATQDGQVVAFEALKTLAPGNQLRRIVTGPINGKPLDVGRTERYARGAVHVAGMFGHTRCAWEQGCDVPASDSDADHIRSFSSGGSTSAENIQPLCSTHNRLKYRREMNPGGSYWKGRTAHRTRKEAGPGGGNDPPDQHTG